MHIYMPMYKVLFFKLLAFSSSENPTILLKPATSTNKKNTVRVSFYVPSAPQELEAIIGRALSVHVSRYVHALIDHSIHPSVHQSINISLPPLIHASILLFIHP